MTAIGPSRRIGNGGYRVIATRRQPAVEGARRSIPEEELRRLVIGGPVGTANLRPVCVAPRRGPIRRAPDGRQLTTPTVSSGRSCQAKLDGSAVLATRSYSDIGVLDLVIGFNVGHTRLLRGRSAGRVAPLTHRG